MNQLQKVIVVGAGLGIGHHLVELLDKGMGTPQRPARPQTDADIRSLEAAQAKRKRREEKRRKIGSDA